VVIVFRVKVSVGTVPCPLSHTSVAFTVQFLNVRQRKLGTIIIQTDRILRHDSADAGSLPMEDFVTHNPNYFKITQPGSSSITHPLQWIRTLLSRGNLKDIVNILRS
jgi:hypothetical protein